MYFARFIKFEVFHWLTTTKIPIKLDSKEIFHLFIDILEKRDTNKVIGFGCLNYC